MIGEQERLLSKIGYISKKKMARLDPETLCILAMPSTLLPLFRNYGTEDAQERLDGVAFERHAGNRRHHGKRKTRFFSIARRDMRPPSFFFFSMNFFPLQNAPVFVQALRSTTRALSLTSQSKKGGGANAETGSETEQNTTHPPVYFSKSEFQRRKTPSRPSSISARGRSSTPSSSEAAAAFSSHLFFSFFCLGFLRKRERVPAFPSPSVRRHLRTGTGTSLTLALSLLSCSRQASKAPSGQENVEEEEEAIFSSSAPPTTKNFSLFRHFASLVPSHHALVHRQQARVPRAHARADRRRRR